MHESLKENSSFYPTPELLIERMWRKIPRDDRSDLRYILEPSAGKGDIVKFIDKVCHHRRTIHCIEKDPILADSIRGSRGTVIDSDFLAYSGPDKYDLIIANPPFDHGDKHLLKAIEIMYSGHIVFLLNAETLKNPFSNTRQLLVKKLEELNADIEYIDNAFNHADRKTSVNVALIHIHIKKDIEEDLFDGVTQAQDPDPDEIEDPQELMTRDSIKNLVIEYNRAVDVGMQTLMDFYKNYNHISKYMYVLVGEEIGDRGGHYDHGTLTDQMKKRVNLLVEAIRIDYWNKVLQLEVVAKRLTKKRREEFDRSLKLNESMDFTESNIRQFVVNMVDGYEAVLMRAVNEVFENMTIDYAWDPDLHTANTHYFDGWKTNKAYFVNKKVILPRYSFTGYASEMWGIKYDTEIKLHDLDAVMTYFDDCPYYTSISEALTRAFAEDIPRTRKVISTYFEISVFKKGTIHLTFRDEDIRRRFNVTACQGKNWLPEDYGRKKYDNLDPEEKAAADSFEGKASYSKNVIPGSLFAIKNDLPQIEDLTGQAIEPEPVIEIEPITTTEPDFNEVTPAHNKSMALFSMSV